MFMICVIKEFFCSFSVVSLLCRSIIVVYSTTWLSTSKRTR